MLLTRTRAVWVAFVIGLVVQQLSLPVIRLPRRMLTLVVVAVLALPLTGDSGVPHDDRRTACPR